MFQEYDQMQKNQECFLNEFYLTLIQEIIDLKKELKKEREETQLNLNAEYQEIMDQIG